MDKPKESGRQSGIVKDARSILTESYNVSEQKRQPQNRADGESPTEYAVGKLEKAEEKAARTGLDTGKRAVNEYKTRTPKAKIKRQEKKETAQHEAGQFRSQSTNSTNADSADYNPPGSCRTSSGGTSSAFSSGDKNPGASQAKQRLKEKRASEQIAGSPYSSCYSSPASANNMSFSTAGTNSHISKNTNEITQKRALKAKDGNFAVTGKGRKTKAGMLKQRTDKVKTAGHVKKTIKRNPQKAAKEGFKRSQQIAKATKQAAKKVAEFLARVGAAAIRAIVSIAAACTPLVIIIVGIAIVGAIVASPFGLFMAGGDDNATESIQYTMLELSEEYRGKLLDIIRTNQHSEMRFTFTNQGHNRQDNLIDVLAIYAVKTAASDDGTEVVMLDNSKIEKLKAIFCDMQDISYERVNEQKYDADTDTYTDYYVLYLRATCRGAWEMADTYSFDANQRQILTEMLGSSYESYFNALIGSASLFFMVGDGGAVVGTGDFVWPSAASTYVTSPFGYRIHPLTGAEDNHYGIDIGAGENTGVLAADGGSVVTAGWHYSYGNYIEIDHGNGYKTLYAHNNTLLVGAGDAVEQGQQIALVGSTGESGGFHIHFEVKLNCGRVDPLQFFDNYTAAW